jgi:hypothetical protein
LGQSLSPESWCSTFWFVVGTEFESGVVVFNLLVCGWYRV